MGRVRIEAFENPILTHASGPSPIATADVRQTQGANRSDSLNPELDRLSFWEVPPLREGNHAERETYYCRTPGKSRGFAQKFHSTVYDPNDDRPYQPFSHAESDCVGSSEGRRQSQTTFCYLVALSGLYWLL